MTKELLIIVSSLVILCVIAIAAIFLLINGFPPEHVNTDLDRRMLVNALGIMPSTKNILKYEVGWTDSTFFYRFTMNDSEFMSVITNGWKAIPGIKRGYGPLWWRPQESGKGWTYHERQRPQYGLLARNDSSGLTYFRAYHE